MNQSDRNRLIFCVGKMRGMLSMIEFTEDDDSDSTFINDKLIDVLNDMEAILYGADDLPY